MPYINQKKKMAVSGICVSNWKEETPVLKVYSEAEVHTKRAKKKRAPSAEHW